MRVFQYVLTLLVLLALNFFLPRLMPGDPLAYLEGDPTADAPVLMTEEMRAELRAYYGLDKPLAAQFSAYLAGLAQGDLGWSIYFNAPVACLLWENLRWTLFLGGTAAALYTVLGIGLGALAAWRHGTRVDTGLLLALLGVGSWPPFFLGMLLIIVFSYRLGLFPIGGARSAIGAGLTGWARVGDLLHHWTLPALTLVLTHLPGVALLTRNALVEVLTEDYVRTARSKGLREFVVFLRHVLPNGLLSILTLIAMRFGFMLMGTLFVEVTFAYPGMGSLIAQAGAARDYPLLQGAFLVTSVVLLASNLCAEALYTRLDPRVRVAGEVA